MAIRLESVVKKYASTVALNGLGFEFPTGKLTGFLGPNGAGKTTTFRACLGLTSIDAGQIDVLGMRVGPDTRRIVKSVGAVVEEPGLHKTLNAVDNLRVAAWILGSGEDRIDDLLEFVDLAQYRDRKVEVYSKGMRQRLALALAMLGDPEVLLLDEPLDGLDPAGQVALRTRLRALVDEGRTVVVSSHDMADVEQLADHIVVIDRGRLVAEGPLGDVLGDSRRFRVAAVDLHRAIASLASAGFEVAAQGEWAVVLTDDGEAISRTLAGAGVYPTALVPERRSLESVFLGLTGSES